VTAIGHKDDVSLLQQVADKAFITPTAFGQFLNEIYNHTIEEAAHFQSQTCGIGENAIAGWLSETDRQPERTTERGGAVESGRRSSCKMRNWCC
jgi:exonuclease VII large subunit